MSELMKQIYYALEIAVMGDVPITLTVDQLKELIAEIDRLKAERRWIPVSERLPGYYEFVNVYRKYGGRTSCSRSTCGDPAWLHFPFYDVTHWMPLPTPPEDE